MAIREKCIREKECLAFHVERRSNDPNIYLLVETWSDRDFFEKIQLNREYYPPLFYKDRSHDGCAPGDSLLDAGRNLCGEVRLRSLLLQHS
jgi:hypothetical protein